MDNRKLTETEENIVKKQLGRLKSERAKEELLVEEANFILYKKIPYITLPKLEGEWQKQKEMSNLNIMNIDQGIAELERQLREGIEIKPKEETKIARVGGFIIEIDKKIKFATIKINPNDIDFFKRIIIKEWIDLKNNEEVK